MCRFFEKQSHIVYLQVRLFSHPLIPEKSRNDVSGSSCSGEGLWEITGAKAVQLVCQFLSRTGTHFPSEAQVLLREGKTWTQPDVLLFLTFRIMDNHLLFTTRLHEG